MERIPANELKLGDVINAFIDGEPWSTAIVSNVSENDVSLFRPYGTNADFSYTGGVICYVGIEEFSIPRNPKHLFTVYRRQTLK